MILSGNSRDAATRGHFPGETLHFTFAVSEKEEVRQLNHVVDFNNRSRSVFLLYYFLACDITHLNARTKESFIKLLLNIPFVFG